MFNPSCFAFSVIIVNVFLTGINTQLQCKDEENQPVDWFVMYKIPKTSRSSNRLIKKGLAYAYITSNNVKAGWKLSKISVASKSSIPGYTLAPLYTRNDSILWTLYNDQALNRTASKYGHTKGVVMADDRQGFWLIHSVPFYPPAPDHGTDPTEEFQSTNSVESSFQSDNEYNYPNSGRTYGQSFLCISVNESQFNPIGEQLMYNQILPFKNNLPENLTRQYECLTKAANKARIKNAPYNHTTTIRSLGRTEFLSFAKSDKWEKDLYDDFVAPHFGADLLTETWPNGRGRLPSYCNGSQVINIKSINIREVDVAFNTTRDHSKWAVVTSGMNKLNWVCVGDINRSQAQLERGGGTVCLNLYDIWISYRTIVNEEETCPRKRGRS